MAEKAKKNETFEEKMARVRAKLEKRAHGVGLAIVSRSAHAKAELERQAMALLDDLEESLDEDE